VILSTIANPLALNLLLTINYAEILGYSREQFIRLSLQDLIDREGLNVQVEIICVDSKKHRRFKKAA
jgi:hypothetical protein